ncbi:MAG TPA: hypothetical protein V6D05_00430 [Stenomitos sp.]
MTTTQPRFGSCYVLDDLTAAITVAIWKEVHDSPPEPTQEFLYAPGELHGMTPQLPGHLGAPMLRRAHRRHPARGELTLA